MIFQGSGAEARFSGIWDSSVVFYDKKIRDSLKSERFFRSPTIDFSTILIGYKDCSINFIQNVSRQLSNYEDKKYFYQYLEESKNITISDLNDYKTRLINNNVFQYTEAIEIHISKIEQTFKEFDVLYSRFDKSKAINRI